MKLSKTAYERALYIVLAVCAATDVAMYCYVNQLRKAELVAGVVFTNPIYERDSRPPDGYDPAGNRVSEREGSSPGWVVHYSSPRCEYSRSNRTQWYMLRSSFVKKGYKVYEMTPSASEAYPNNAPEVREETQVTWVDVDWMKRYRFRGTPTTLVFNSNGALVWSHEGVMDDETIQSAIRHSL